MRTLGMTGKKHTMETKKKMSLARKGRKLLYDVWNKGKKGIQKHSEETKRKIGLSNKGIPKPKPVGFGKGKHPSLEARKKMSEAKKGEKSPNWKGGTTPINNNIRHSLEYKLWRKSVYERDNYTCVFCNKKGGELQADHIKPFAYYPELRFAIDNGRTLCVTCHRTTDTWGKYK